MSRLRGFLDPKTRFPFSILLYAQILFLVKWRMAKWNESEHPRDDDGKFTDGTGGGKTQWITSKRDFSNVQADEKDLQYDSENGKIKQNKGFINIQFFGRIKDQTPRQLKKTICSLDKRIQEHKEKIENPKLAYKEEWDTFSDARKNRLYNTGNKRLKPLRNSVQMQ